MKRVNLTKVRQKDKVFYTFVADPRLIVEMIPQYKEKEVQELQRPWIKKRVDEIADYVDGRVAISSEYKATGMIPNTPILNIRDQRIPIQSNGDELYIEIPENDNEFEKYRDSLDIIDGQHRVRAFGKEFRRHTFLDSDPYEMVFTVYDRASTNDKREVFMITNEKQKKVETNLLRSIRKDLNLLGDDEAIYDFVALLNEEDFSPLKGRIAIGAEKITKGFQETQMSKILDKSGVFKKLSIAADDNYDSMAKALSNYLKAWEDEYKVSFQDPKKDTLTKISGLRYVFWLFPTMFDIIDDSNKKCTDGEFRKLIKDLRNAVEVEFDSNDIFVDNLAFRGEGATIKLAQDHSLKLKDYKKKVKRTHNALEGI